MLSQIEIQKLIAQLTATEVKVLGFIAQGLENQEIADITCNSERTIRTHVSNMLTKLFLANRTKLAIFALQNGFANLAEIKLQHVNPIA